jgi:predicted RNA polymerase sigma factor
LQAQQVERRRLRLCAIRWGASRQARRVVPVLREPVGSRNESIVRLALVERPELDHDHYLHATRAERLRRLDRLEDARAVYGRALELVHSDAERLFLERRLAELV